MSVTDSERIQKLLRRLGPEDQAQEAKALAEGYTDAVCSKCQTVFLAYHHFVDCGERSCPMIAREADGTPKASLLEQILGPSLTTDDGKTK